MSLTLTTIEKATGTPVIRSELWQQTDGSWTWKVWHPFSNWQEEGTGANPPDCYALIRTAVEAALASATAAGEIKMMTSEIRVIRVHRDA